AVAAATPTPANATSVASGASAASLGRGSGGSPPTARAASGGRATAGRAIARTPLTPRPPPVPRHGDHGKRPRRLLGDADPEGLGGGVTVRSTRRPGERIWSTNRPISAIPGLGSRLATEPALPSLSADAAVVHVLAPQPGCRQHPRFQRNTAYPAREPHLS